MVERTELLGHRQLPELARFSEPAILPGEMMDVALATTQSPIHLITTLESAEAAKAYRYIVGKDAEGFRISVNENPIEQTLKEPEDGEVKLVMHSATDPVLFQRMFADGPQLGQLLMAHVYEPLAEHQSPLVHCIGATKTSQNILADSMQEMHAMHAMRLLFEMDERRKEILGGVLFNLDFRNVLRSDSVKHIRAHALGPVGTNISQAMERYIKTVGGIEEKTEIIVHDGVEPREYAAMAREEVHEGVVPIHMECAVFYDMAALFNERSDEVVFADHHDMLLDSMQLASVAPIEELADRGVIRIATHPSPRPLIMPWVESGNAEWIKATSNAAAAQMVFPDEGEAKAEACVTTGSGLRKVEGLVSHHVFGRPNMFFTVGTSLNQEQLRAYQQSI